MHNFDLRKMINKSHGYIFNHIIYAIHISILNDDAIKVNYIEMSFK